MHFGVLYFFLVVPWISADLDTVDSSTESKISTNNDEPKRENAELSVQNENVTTRENSTHINLIARNDEKVANETENESSSHINTEPSINNVQNENVTTSENSTHINLTKRNNEKVANETENESSTLIDTEPSINNVQNENQTTSANSTHKDLTRRNKKAKETENGSSKIFDTESSIINMLRSQYDEDQTLCGNAEFLLSILSSLIPLLRNDIPQNSKTSYVLNILKDLLQSSPEAVQDTEVMYKINDLLQSLEKYHASNSIESKSLRTSNNDVSNTGGYKSKLVFKFELPPFDNSDCTVELLKIVKVVQDAIARLIMNPVCKSHISTAQSLLMKDINKYLITYESNQSQLHPSQPVQNILFKNQPYQPTQDMSDSKYPAMQPNYIENVYPSINLTPEQITNNFYGGPVNKGISQNRLVPDVIYQGLNKIQIPDDSPYGHGSSLNLSPLVKSSIDKPVYPLTDNFYNILSSENLPQAELASQTSNPDIFHNPLEPYIIYTGPNENGIPKNTPNSYASSPNFQSLVKGNIKKPYQPDDANIPFFPQNNSPKADSSFDTPFQPNPSQIPYGNIQGGSLDPSTFIETEPESVGYVKIAPKQITLYSTPRPNSGLELQWQNRNLLPITGDEGSAEVVFRPIQPSHIEFDQPKRPQSYIELPRPSTSSSLNIIGDEGSAVINFGHKRPIALVDDKSLWYKEKPELLDVTGEYGSHEIPFGQNRPNLAVDALSTGSPLSPLQILGQDGSDDAYFDQHRQNPISKLLLSGNLPSLDRDDEGSSAMHDDKLPRYEQKPQPMHIYGEYGNDVFPIVSKQSNLDYISPSSTLAPLQIIGDDGSIEMNLGNNRQILKLPESSSLSLLDRRDEKSFEMQFDHKQPSGAYVDNLPHNTQLYKHNSIWSHPPDMAIDQMHIIPHEININYSGNEDSSKVLPGSDKYIDKNIFILIKEDMAIIERNIPQLHFNVMIREQNAKIRSLINQQQISIDQYVSIINLYEKLIEYIKQLNMSNEIMKELLLSMTNGGKLELYTGKSKVIELTYLIKRPTPVIYQPYYYIKYRLPYISFKTQLETILTIKPYLRYNPLKLYEEIVAMSKVAEVSPDFKAYGKEDILKQTFNSGILIGAKVVKEIDADKDVYATLDKIKEIDVDFSAEDIYQLVKDLDINLKANSWQENYLDVSMFGNSGINKNILNKKQLLILRNNPSKSNVFTKSRPEMVRAKKLIAHILNQVNKISSEVNARHANELTFSFRDDFNNKPQINKSLNKDTFRQFEQIDELKKQESLDAHKSIKNTYFSTQSNLYEPTYFKLEGATNYEVKKDRDFFKYQLIDWNNPSSSSIKPKLFDASFQNPNDKPANNGTSQQNVWQYPASASVGSKLLDATIKAHKFKTVSTPQPIVLEHQGSPYTGTESLDYIQTQNNKPYTSTPLQNSVWEMLTVPSDGSKIINDTIKTQNSKPLVTSTLEQIDLKKFDGSSKGSKYSDAAQKYNLESISSSQKKTLSKSKLSDAVQSQNFEQVNILTPRKVNWDNQAGSFIESKLSDATIKAHEKKPLDISLSQQIDWNNSAASTKSKILEKYDEPLDVTTFKKMNWKNSEGSPIEYMGDIIDNLHYVKNKAQSYKYGSISTSKTDWNNQDSSPIQTKLLDSTIKAYYDKTLDRVPKFEKIGTHLKNPGGSFTDSKLSEISQSQNYKPVHISSHQQAVWGNPASSSIDSSLFHSTSKMRSNNQVDISTSHENVWGKSSNSSVWSKLFDATINAQGVPTLQKIKFGSKPLKTHSTSDIKMTPGEVDSTSKIHSNNPVDFSTTQENVWGKSSNSSVWYKLLDATINAQGVPTSQQIKFGSKPLKTHSTSDIKVTPGEVNFNVLNAYPVKQIQDDIVKQIYYNSQPSPAYSHLGKNSPNNAYLNNLNVHNLQPYPSGAVNSYNNNYNMANTGNFIGNNQSLQPLANYKQQYLRQNLLNSYGIKRPWSYFGR